MQETMLEEFPLQFLLLLPLVFLILKLFKLSSSRRKPLPPGPKPWPIIGNILDMGRTLPHISLTTFSQVYGPLMYLRLGSALLVVASSPEAAKEILKTHDKLLSARYVPRAHPFTPAECDQVSLGWATTCTDHWKFLRTLCRTELFSAKAIESQAALRETKASELLHFLETKEGQVANIAEVVFAAIFNILGHLIFSKDFIGWEDERDANNMKGLVWKMMKLATAPNISDFYPVLASLDLQGLRKEASKCLQEMFSVWEVIVKERRKNHSQQGGSIQRDFLDVFIAKEFTDGHINHLAMELFSAGSDTSAGTIEWAMAELLRNKEVLEKLEEELDREINAGSIKESHVARLPYLNACVKETLRLHPPAPLLVPHRAPETLEVMGYTIPKESRLFVNVWAIGRDPNIWEDPLSFKPERFLGSNMDFKGQDFEFLPFGAGRRMCPGLPMADVQVHLILASLVHHFQWSLPNNEDPVKLDMSEKFGLTLQKEKPLLAIPKRRFFFK